MADMKIELASRDQQIIQAMAIATAQLFQELKKQKTSPRGSLVFTEEQAFELTKVAMTGAVPVSLT